MTSSESPLFKLTINSIPYDIPIATLSKSSRHCAHLIRSNIFAFSVTTTLSPDPFDPWTLTPENSFALLDLAQQLDAPALKRFLGSYISTNHLRQNSPLDPLGSLIAASESATACDSLIPPVAAIVNEVLEDARLFTLPPEVIFQIVTSAADGEIDQDRLISFTIHFFERNPSAAVPLILLIDFDRLSEHEADELFLRREIHRENLNFFIGSAMSETRDRASRALRERFALLRNNATAMFTVFENWLGETTNAARDAWEAEFAGLRAQVEAQGLELEELARELREDGERLAAQEAEQRRELEELRAEIDAVAADTTDVWKPTDFVESEIVKLREELSAKIKEVREREGEVMKELHQQFREEADAVDVEIAKLEKTQAEVARNTQGAFANVAEARATLFVKIVRDRVKGDPLRKSMDKLAPFRTGMLGVDFRQAELADKFLSELGKKIDRICPIVGADQA